MAKYGETFCSQCGGAFGPGDHGFSHCENHKGMEDYSERASGFVNSPAFIERLIDNAKTALAKLTPEQQREMWEAQRESWAKQDKD